MTQLPLGHLPDGRVRVDEFFRAMTAEGVALDDVYVIGDSAAALKPDGTFHPRLAQTSVAMGSYLGDALVRRALGRSVEPFSFHEPGYIISLGKHSSVVDLFGVPFSGRLAWLVWAASYLVKMVGFRKQIEVGLDHLTHLVFEHDSAQILNRRAVLSDEEINLSLRPIQGGADVELERAAETAGAGERR